MRIINLKLNSNNILYILSIAFLSTCSFICHKTKPFQPLYLFYFPILILFLGYIFAKGKILLTKSQIYCIICIIYWLLVIAFQASFSFSPINVAISISYFFIGTQLIKKLSYNQVNSICKFTILCSLLYILLETFLRVSGKFNLILLAYANMYIRGMIKENSFMSIDSNMVAIYTITLTCLSFYMYKNVENSKFYLFTFISSILLTISTISRAALIFCIISLLIFSIIDFAKKHVLKFLIKKHAITLKLLLTLPCVFIVPVYTIIKLFSLFSNDYSWGTKIDLMKETLLYLQSVPLYNLFFGIGTDIDEILKYFDRATHLFITSYLVYYGLIGLILLLIFWFYIIKETKNKGFFIILPTLLLGFALTLPSCQIFYVSLAIIYYFEYILPKQKKGT